MNGINSMLKNAVCLIALSTVIIFSLSYTQSFMQLLLSGHDWISEYLGQIFSGDKGGLIAKQLLAILAIPLLAGSVFALLYWIVKRSWFPYFMQIVWITWILQIAGLIVLNKAL